MITQQQVGRLLFSVPVRAAVDLVLRAAWQPAATRSIVGKELFPSQALWCRLVSGSLCWTPLWAGQAWHPCEAALQSDVCTWSAMACVHAAPSRTIHTHWSRRITFLLLFSIFLYIGIGDKKVRVDYFINLPKRKGSVSCGVGVDPFRFLFLFFYFIIFLFCHLPRTLPCI